MKNRSALRGRIWQLVRRLVTDDAGVTAIEYGLIAALVAIVCITAWQELGNNLSTTFNDIANSL